MGYISLGNKASYRATEVIVKVELQTSRQKVVLYDNTTSPLPFLGSGSRHDFIVQHDIKELGVHNLICSTVYTAADGERRYTPETFKFTSANPLYVKTKGNGSRDSTWGPLAIWSGLSKQWNNRSPVVLNSASLAFLVLDGCCCCHAHAHVCRTSFSAVDIDTAFHAD